MDGPFAVSIVDPEASFDDFLFWAGDFGYQGVACASVAVKNFTMLASFRSLSGRDESRHVVCSIQPDDPSQAQEGQESSALPFTPIKYPFVEFRSQGSHRIPFRSSLLPSTTTTAVYCLMGDEATSAGHIYSIDADRPFAGCERIAPAEVLITNAGSALIDCSWGVMQQVSEDAHLLKRSRVEFGDVSWEGQEEQPLEKTSCIGLLTEKYFYIYTLQI